MNKAICISGKACKWTSLRLHAQPLLGKAATYSVHSDTCAWDHSVGPCPIPATFLKALFP